MDRENKLAQRQRSSACSKPAATQRNSGQAGPIYIEPRNEPGNYDREVFLVLKEFEPTLSRGGDMAQDFLAPAAHDKALEEAGEAAMRASLAKGMPHGFEVGYGLFSINGRMLGQGEPVRVKLGERVLFHVLNASATEIRSVALPGHTFRVVALDGNLVPTPAEVPVLWIGTAERVSAIVEMNHPGVWVMGDLADDDRDHGMGIVVEYAGRTGKPRWSAPKPSKWDYTRFGKPGTAAAMPDETTEMIFEKNNAALDGFNQWTINGTPFSMETMEPKLPIRQGRRYRLHMRNASDDIHPVHLHRHRLRVDRDRRESHGWRAQGRCDAGRLSGGGGGLHSRQSRAHTVPLPPATAHGLRFHGVVRLCVKAAYIRCKTMAREKLKWQNIDADDLPAEVKRSFNAMVEAEATFKADLEKLLKTSLDRLARASRT